MTTKRSARTSGWPTREIALLIAEPIPAFATGIEPMSAVVRGATTSVIPIPKRRTEGSTSMRLEVGGAQVDTSPGSKLAGWVPEQLAEAGLKVDKAGQARLVTWLGDEPSRLPGLLELLRSTYGAGARHIKVSATKGGEAVEPTEENVVKGTYPIWRHLFIYVNPALDKGEVAAYLKWIRGDEGQKLVKDVGYYPLPANLRSK